MVTFSLGEFEVNTRADIVNTLNEIGNAIESGYNSGVTFGGVWWDISGGEEPEEDEYKEFTCGATTIDRDMYESMPSPMDTSSLTDEDMQRLANDIEFEMKRWQEWLEDGSINQGQYDEHWWRVAEEMGINFGMTYY